MLTLHLLNLLKLDTRANSFSGGKSKDVSLKGEIVFSQGIQNQNHTLMEINTYRPM